MILVIDGRHYPVVSVEDLSLRHTLALQRELVVTNISRAKTWADVKALLAEFEAMAPEDRANHPEALFLTALTVWACRVMAGDEVSLLDAVDVPASRLKWIKEPADRAPAADAKGTAPAGKARPRKAGASRA